MNNEKSKLSNQLRHAIQLKHYSYKTEKSYVNWVRRFYLFHKKRNLNEMGNSEVRTFLSYLATDLHVSSSTQNQALNALVFFYKYVIKSDLGIIDAMRARRPKRLPVVLTSRRNIKANAFFKWNSRYNGKIVIWKWPQS
jgi:site-specific recombinase XerD